MLRASCSPERDHHFPAKLELFEAVLERVMQQIVQALDQRRDRSGSARLEAARDVYLERCADPTVLAVVFRDRRARSLWLKWIGALRTSAA